MVNIRFLLESNFISSPLLQQTFHSPQLRTPPITYINAFKLNYSPDKVIRYSPKLTVKCFCISPKPKGETGCREDNEIKSVGMGSNFNEVAWISTKNVFNSLQITGIVLGLIFLYNHHTCCIALAASGGRMGGSSFSSFSSSSSDSSSSSSYPSSSSSSDSSYSSSSWSSSSESPTSYSSSSSYEPSSSSYDESPSSYSSSSWWDASESPSSYSSSWWDSSEPSTTSTKIPKSSSSTKPKSYTERGELGTSISVKPALAVEPVTGVDILFACGMIVLALGFVYAISSPDTLFPKKTSVFMLQVGLSGKGKSLQRDLNQIAETADSSTPQGLTRILRETTQALLRYPEHCISGYSSVDAKKNILEVEKLFNQLSIEERSKFDEETMVNVNNIKKKSATTQRSNDISNEYIVVTIIVAAEGVHKLPAINNSSKLKEALQKLMSISSTNVKAVDVMWTPQHENDNLTEQEYLEDYSSLRPL